MLYGSTGSGLWPVDDDLLVTKMWRFYVVINYDILDNILSYSSDIQHKNIGVCGILPHMFECSNMIPMSFVAICLQLIILE